MRVGWTLLDKINTKDNYYKYDNLSSHDQGMIHVLIGALVIYIYYFRCVKKNEFI